MRWVARFFANAVSRRCAVLIVAALLAWAGIGTARAADTYLSTRGEASLRCYQGLSEARQRSIQLYPNPPYRLDRESCGSAGTKVLLNSKWYFAMECSVQVGTSTHVQCLGNRYLYPEGATCDKEPSYTGSLPWASYVGTVRNGSLACRRGCDGFWSATGDGETGTWTPTGGNCPTDQKSNCANMGPSYYWNAILGVCSPHDIECPDGQTKDAGGSCKEACPAGMSLMSDGTCKAKENECPAGNVKAPSGQCLPGDGQCAAGEVKGKDGTCKRDADGDGQPDAGEDEGTTDETFSGGDSCNAPPACSGSPIMCGQARIQWRIDCNTRRNTNISGGACSSMPICTGEKCDAVEYSSLLMQWRTACALEKAAKNGDGASDPNVAAIKDALTGNGGTPDIGAEGDSSGSWAGGSGQGESIDPDISGYGWGGGSCPTIPSVDFMGVSIQFDAGPLCRWLALGSYFVMGLAALGSLRIVGGGIA